MILKRFLFLTLVTYNTVVATTTTTIATVEDMMNKTVTALNSNREELTTAKEIDNLRKKNTTLSSSFLQKFITLDVRDTCTDLKTQDAICIENNYKEIVFTILKNKEYKNVVIFSKTGKQALIYKTLLLKAGVNKNVLALSFKEYRKNGKFFEAEEKKCK